MLCEARFHASSTEKETRTFYAKKCSLYGLSTVLELGQRQGRASKKIIVLVVQKKHAFRKAIELIVDESLKPRVFTCLKHVDRPTPQICGFPQVFPRAHPDARLHGRQDSGCSRILAASASRSRGRSPRRFQSWIFLTPKLSGSSIPELVASCRSFSVCVVWTGYLSSTT